MQYDHRKRSIENNVYSRVHQCDVEQRKKRLLNENVLASQ